MLLFILPAGALQAAQIGNVLIVTDLAELPAHIRPIRGNLSLVADFDNKMDGIVSLYLINGTQSTVTIPTQDGDLYCKRVAQDPNGDWRRCDSHQYSWCGNSYIQTNLPAGGFLTWQQATDSTEGTPRKVRFRLFQRSPFDLESNEGSGSVADAEISACRYDAMAMAYGPFEDIAAVATGKIQGGQGSSIDGMSDALRALGRFPAEKELLPILKTVIARLVESPDSQKRNAYYYTSCLGVLASAKGVSVEPETCWQYVAEQIHNEKFPWRNEALVWLLESFRWDTVKLKPLLDGVLEKPGHPAMAAACSGYANVVGTPSAGNKLVAISTDASYPPSDQQLARGVRERLYVNPFLGIEIIPGDGGDDEHLEPLKLVTITNISPQAITLPVADAAGLVVVFLESGSHTQRLKTLAGPAVKPGKLKLRPGGSVEMRDFKWWTLLSPKTIQPDETYLVSFQAASPGLWEVRAKLNWSWSLTGEQILNAIKVSQEQ